MKFTLPISDGYVASWGLWEAVREIWQNALDEANEECKAMMTYEDGVLRIETTQGSLDMSTLVLGNTSKKARPGQRGKFGEGYKLSLLVLARMGFVATVYTADEMWVARIEYDEDFTSNVLNIYTTKLEESREGVLFLIGMIAPGQWQDIQKNIRPQSEFYNTILEEPSEAGRVYVGGLYVTTVKGFKCGYAFRAGEINLDRDRGMVSGFDLAYKTSQMWTDRGSGRALKLMDEEAPDVKYVESHATPTSALVTQRYEHFVSSYGSSAVPVSSQTEIENATKAGVKWVLVPEPVKSLLRMVKSWFIPTSKSPAELIKDFKNKYEWRLTNEMKHDLDEIIQTFEPKSQEAK